MTNKEELKKLLNQYMSRNYTPSIRQRKDMAKYIAMLSKEHSENDYKNIEEKFNAIGESYEPPFSLKDDIMYFFFVTLPKKFKKNKRVKGEER